MEKRPDQLPIHDQLTTQTQERRSKMIKVSRNSIRRSTPSLNSSSTAFTEGTVLDESDVGEDELVWVQHDGKWFTVAHYELNKVPSLFTESKDGILEVSKVSREDLLLIEKYIDLYNEYKDRNWRTSFERCCAKNGVDHTRVIVPENIRRFFAVCNDRLGSIKKICDLINESTDRVSERKSVKRNVEHPLYHFVDEFIEKRKKEAKPIEIDEKVPVSVHMKDGSIEKISWLRLIELGGLIVFNESEWEFEMIATREQYDRCISQLIDEWELCIQKMKGRNNQDRMEIAQEYNQKTLQLIEKYRNDFGIEKVVELMATAVEAESRMPEDIQILMDAVVRFLSKRVEIPEKILIEEARSGHIYVKDVEASPADKAFLKLREGTVAMIQCLMGNKAQAIGNASDNDSSYESLAEGLARKRFNKAAFVSPIASQAVSSTIDLTDKYSPTRMDLIPVFHRPPTSPQPQVQLNHSESHAKKRSKYLFKPQTHSSSESSTGKWP